MQYAILLYERLRGNRAKSRLVYFHTLRDVRLIFKTSPLPGYGVHTSPSKVIREGVAGSKRQWKIQSEYTRKQWMEKHLEIRDSLKGASLYEALGKHQSVSIRRISKNRAEQDTIGFWRMRM